MKSEGEVPFAFDPIGLVKEVLLGAFESQEIARAVIGKTDVKGVHDRKYDEHQSRYEPWK